MANLNALAIKKINMKNPRITIKEVVEDVAKSVGSCHVIGQKHLFRNCQI